MPYDSLVSRTDVAGLIPTEYSREIIKSMPASSVAMQSFRQVTIPRGTEVLPVLSVLPEAYWVGETDTGLKQTSEANWENVTLYARELAVIVPIPEAVLEDSSVDLWGEVQPRIAEAFGKKLDAAALFGTSAPAAWPDSIVEQAVTKSNTYTQGSVSGNDISVDISELWGLVEDDGFDVNVQWARKRVRRLLRSLRADDGQPILQNALAQGSPASLYGEDLLYVTNGAWDDTYQLVVGDRNAAILGIRQDLRYKLFTEGVIQDGDGAIALNLMQQDAVALRATMRVAYATANPANRMAGDGGAAGAGFPFAALVTAGS